MLTVRRYAYQQQQRKYAYQQPNWEGKELYSVLEDLQSRSPLVDAARCRALQADLSHAARGSAFVIQSGDCAERFDESKPDAVQAKAAQLELLAHIVESIADVQVVRIGRFAGQYAKPRSATTETLRDGTVLPVYRGDAVNSPEKTLKARRADPHRLRLAYEHAMTCMNSLSVNRFIPADLKSGAPRLYVSHEALLLDYERALVRPDSVQGGHYDSSAHMLWIGDRTRQLDCAHIAFCEEINNPVGVKIGPSTAPYDLRRIVERLAADHPVGRLTLILRLGAVEITQRLPCLLEAVRHLADNVTWLCDPMHGNTRTTRYGQKTRIIDDIFFEMKQFFKILCHNNVAVGGLHLETATSPVTECVEEATDANTAHALPCYQSACDPRLSPEQAVRLVTHAANLLR